MGKKGSSKKRQERPTDLLESISRLFESKKYSDLKITCRGKVFDVNRVVVCTQSKFLEKAADGSFKESAEGIIDLPEDEPDIVDKMIQYLYKRSYDDETITVLPAVSKSPSAESSPTEGTQGEIELFEEKSQSEYSEPSQTNFSTNALVINAKVYILAEKFDIPNLKKLAKEKYETRAEMLWNSPAFTESIQFFYENVPDSDHELKDTVIETAVDHLRELMDRGEFTEMLTSSGEVSLDILRAALDQGVAFKTELLVTELYCKHNSCGSGGNATVYCPWCNQRNFKAKIKPQS